MKSFAQHTNLALARLRELPQGLDNWSAHRPKEEVLRVAFDLAAHITRRIQPPIVTAASDGTIQMKWRTSDLEVSLFVCPDCSLEYIYRSKHSGRKSGNFSPNEVNSLLADF